MPSNQSKQQQKNPNPLKNNKVSKILLTKKIRQTYIQDQIKQEKATEA